jgi:hypothetical protein
LFKNFGGFPLYLPVVSWHYASCVISVSWQSSTKFAGTVLLR